MRGAPWLLALAVAIAGCGGDAVGSDDSAAPAPASFDGFDSVALTPASGARDADAPSGIMHYQVVSGALDWYVSARALAAGRAYRVLLAAADGREYAVASRRAGGDGTFAAHGVETALMNRQCVGTEDPSRRSLTEAGPLTIAIKSDGSRAGGTTGSNLLGSRSSLPCNGNGDGAFDYVLRSAAQIPVAP
jgi:hypothetical protein